MICASGQLVDVAQLQFVIGSKVKPIRVKSLQTLLHDETVLNKFLLATLEGTQMLRASAMVCIGPDGDMWQQTKERLHKQYTPIELDTDGWVTFQPKPENERDVCEITLDGCLDGEFFVNAQCGERQADGSFVQKGKSGDYVVRSREDPTDIWIVARTVFNNTYELR